MITTSEISASEDLLNPCLRERYDQGRTPRTQTFVVLREGVEIGLLIYENWGPPEGFIYEIFVLSENRRGGVGAWVLAGAERLAIELGCTSIKLTARSLDRDQYTDETLISWYEKKGNVNGSGVYA